MRKVIDLGYCMARIDTDERTYPNPAIIIVEPSQPSDEHLSFEAARDIRIWTKADAEKLRDALNQCFPITEEINCPAQKNKPYT